MRKNKHNILVFFCLIGLILPSLRAGSADIGRERLAGLCRLWGVVKYFHPDLAVRDIDWDDALVRAYPRVRDAISAEEYRAALAGLLEGLGDPETRILPLAPASAPAAAPPAAKPAAAIAAPGLEWIENRIAVLRFPDYGYFSDQRKAMGIRDLFKDATRAEALVLDIRRTDGDPADREDSAPYFFARIFRMFFPSLIDRDIPLPSFRYRMYSGYPTQGGSSSGGYYGGFVTMDSSILAASGKDIGERPMVFLLNTRSAGLEDILSGLQIQGAARLVLEGEPQAAGGGVQHAVSLPEGLTALVRTTERVNPDGSVGLAPDLVLPERAETGDPDPAMQAALEIIRGEREIKPQPRAALPAVAPSLREKAYADMLYPDEAYRMLALFRYWNVIEYFFPYKHLIDGPWDDVLLEFVPRMAEAADELEYHLAVAEMGSHIQDTHGFMNSPVLSKYFGTHYPAVEITTVEGRTAITHLFEEKQAATGLKIGDVILSVDGEEIAARRDRLARCLSVSTPQALDWRLNGVLLGGEKDSICRLRVETADGSVREVEMPRSGTRRRSERPYPVFHLLPEGFGYIDLARLNIPQVDEAFALIQDAPAVIFDMRGYPRGTAWSIGPRLAKEKTAVARFQRPENHGTMPDQPSTKMFYQYTEPAPGKTRYTGRVVVLIDVNAISQAEHTCMFLESVAETTFIGTPTNGANGDVTNTVLPGGISAMFTGHDVRHADGSQLQRRGIQPDIRVAPTLAGIREGRDEVLQAAVSYLEGIFKR